MPPKKRSAPSAGSAPKRARQSKLAKENDVTGEEENEIKEVFHIFSTKNDEFKNEKEGVIPCEDVRKALVYVPSIPPRSSSFLHPDLQSTFLPTCLSTCRRANPPTNDNISFRALGLSPSSSSELNSILSALDPTDTGFVPYEPFLSVAAAKLRSRGEDAMVAEVDAAFQLFTKGSDGPITISHLRRIARELKEEGLGDDLFRDMILEANGGAGVAAGVTLEQFHDVMMRAGVF
ncbi:hypothetical protein P170DRAFT_430154 [Aspergillus steynii IBT 23096]|uniref:EF-hand superfamily Ca2+-modulated protein n=1 Tax=Aspergillus steynii IBT 23096 TaxID=1392250 RepID=A0A2I2FUD0_9EURO|nr:uncharacterized protein P170DRAFT_430154 [Aspergillus steynii IBT 23096]PLB44250.1 hypothetical protein P170DRAFT_430154 [Aspergillus steynii IBT 23096]